MTANADYGVSIVESFVPPKNWLPGQEINKDVYAVNTGTVDAFVKETISGVLNYTYEQVVDTWTADCVTLDDKTITAIDGATTDEAGGFLAWTDAKVPTTTIDGKYAAESEVNVTATDGAATEPVSITFTKKYTVGTKEYYEASDGKLYTIDDGVYTLTDKEATTEDLPYSTGPVNSARIVDAAASQGDSATNTVNGNTVDENGDLAPEPGVKPKRWTPPVDGIYIFRRAIDTKAADTSEGAAAGATKTVYQYAGYKFVKGNGTAENPDKYYEIVIGDKEKANYPTDGENHENALTAPFAEWNFDINASSEDIPDITIDENGAIIAGTPKVRYM